MSATEILKEEHRVIERVLRVIGTSANRLERGEEVPVEIFKKAVDFFRNFADRCHHGKEEDLLFPTLEERGVPREGGPLGVMLQEHDQGRSYVKALGEAAEKLREGGSEAREAIIENVRGYVALLTQHIEKEDCVLYRLADDALSEEDKERLIEEYEKVEREKLGEGVHERYLKMVEELEAHVNP